MTEPKPTTTSRDRRVLDLTRPDDNLLRLYVVQSLASLVFAPIVFLPLYFKYRTLRYHLDEEGISVSWGILFRREIHLAYRRIQDINVQRNLLERWLDIGTVQIQTASGSAEAEMTLVGIRDYDAVRDFLYRRMRGLEPDGGGAVAESGAGAGTVSGGPAGGADGEVVGLLLQVRDELAAVRAALESRS